MHNSPRPPRIHHSTSQPFKFFGREAELALLDEALAGGPTSLVALVGPGGQGKTAIMQHWLGRVVTSSPPPDGVFLWSFYRGKEADLFLRELFAYAEGMDHAGEVSASWCVEHLLPILRRERWALVLDGTEVAQYEAGNWFGRFLHPELGRLLEELAAAPMPGVVVLTSRFPLPELARRRHAQMLSLGGLDEESARSLLESLGVLGTHTELADAARACGRHAKAVELLGTLLVRFAAGKAEAFRELLQPGVSASDEETMVASVLAAYQRALPAEQQDMLALATAFRDPPGEGKLLAYLCSPPVGDLLHESWQRTYQPFAERPAGWLAAQLDELVHLRLLERVSRTPGCVEDNVIDAHPLVRRAFEHALGAAGRRASGLARAGFLRGRPDRRRPDSLEDAREEVELFHANCEAGLWEEADSALAGLDNPRYRFLAPAFERDLLLRFYPAGDWKQRPLWPGFRRQRALAICFELLGNFDDALAAYRADDAPLRGDALIALGRLEPLLADTRAAHPWQILWQAYRVHALCLAGRDQEARTAADALVPGDVYEWAHVFECLLRLGRLADLDMRSFLYRPADAGGHRWSDLARQRMRLDFLRVQQTEHSIGLTDEYASLLEAYDQGGLIYERALTRLSISRWLLEQGWTARAAETNGVALQLARQYQMKIIEVDALELAADIDEHAGKTDTSRESLRQAGLLRAQIGYHGRPRP
ncbi:MAG: hypothetical protein AB7K24_04700 [Gemmataceae bacterium]